MPTHDIFLDDQPQPTHTLIASDRIEGTKVCRADGKKIGIVERLMIDKMSGKVAYAVLSFGGILGFGKRHLPVPWERLQYSVVHGGYFAKLTAEELARAPSYSAGADFDWGDRSEETRVHRYYGSKPYWS